MLMQLTHMSDLCFLFPSLINKLSANLRLCTRVYLKTEMRININIPKLLTRLRAYCITEIHFGWGQNNIWPSVNNRDITYIIPAPLALSWYPVLESTTSIKDIPPMKSTSNTWNYLTSGKSEQLLLCMIMQSVDSETPSYYSKLQMSHACWISILPWLLTNLCNNSSSVPLPGGKLFCPAWILGSGLGQSFSATKHWHRCSSGGWTVQVPNTWTDPLKNK